MPDTRITWARLRNHLHYGKWIYAVIALVCLFFGDLLYTMTEYRPPAERKVEFQLVCGAYVDTDRLNGVAARLLADGQAQDDTLEEVSFLSIQYSGDPNTDVYGAQKYTVMVAAGEGDVYIVPETLFVSLWAQNGLSPLDGYIASGDIGVTGMDLTRCTYPDPPAEITEETVLPEPGTGQVYGVPASNLAALAEIGYRGEEPAYAVLMGYSKNPETSARVMGDALQLLAQPLPKEEAVA